MEEHIKKINPYPYRLRKELVYLWMAIIITGGYYSWAAYSFYNDGFASLTGPAIILGFVTVFFFLHLLSMASIRINSVRVGPNQFPKIWQAVEKLSSQLGLPKPPDMYVLHMGGELNAFATRLVSRKLLVLYSDLAEALVEGHDQKQLEAVVAHELAHHALNHTHIYNWFLGPADFIPFFQCSIISFTRVFIRSGNESFN